INVTVDAPPKAPPSQLGLPGKPLGELGHNNSGGGGSGGGSGSSRPGGSTSSGPNSSGSSNGPSSSGGSPQSSSHGPGFPGSQPQPQPQPSPTAQRNAAQRNAMYTPPPLRNKNGAPNPHNPTFSGDLPGPNNSTSVPNFVIRQFQVP